MLVSAISLNDSNSYNISSSVPYYNNKAVDNINDTSFNSLTSFKKSVPQEKLSQVYDNINEWKDFCHGQIMGKHLNIIA